MRLLPLLAAAALLAWLWRQLRGAAGSQTAPPRSQPGDPAWDEDEDGVQPADPRLWMPMLHEGELVLSIHDPIVGRIDSITEDAGGVHLTGAYDPTYIEAREVAIRRGGQSSERSLEGT